MGREEISTIKKFHFWCQKILPLVYENELSYYETLCRVKEKLNETIEVVNTIYDVIIKDVTEITDALDKKVDDKIENLEAKVNQQLADNLNRINQIADELEKQLEAQKQQIADQLQKQDDEFKKKVADLEAQIRDQIQLLKNFVYANNDLIYAYIDNEINKVIQMIPEITSTQVHNPLIGGIEPIQQTLNMMTEVFRAFAEPAINWDNLSYIRAGAFDESGITAWEWDIFGWDYFETAKDRIWKEPITNMRSPFTGEMTYYKDVIESLFDLHRGYAYTAAKFDSAEIDAEFFDQSEVTSFNYDFEGTILLN